MQCLRDRGKDLIPELRKELRVLVSDRDVNRVVFYYMDHGHAEFAGQRPGAKLQPNDFAGFAHLAWHVGKHILFVIDACHSTKFAENSWGMVSDPNPGWDMGDPAKFVGFLTSGRNRCFTSATVVSQDPSLVYMLPGNHPPHDSPFVDGCRLHNSMFTRQLNLATAYELDADSTLTLAQLPDYLNDQPPYRNGFHAEFIGRGTEFGLLPMRFFFPWRPASGNEPVRGRPGVHMTDLVPSEAMGLLYDDAHNFWRGRPQNLEFAFVEISRGPGGDVVAVRGRGTLQRVLGDTHPVARLVRGKCTATRSSRSHRAAVCVPLGMVFAYLPELPGFARVRRDPALDVPSEDCRLLEQYMREINGPIETGEWTFLSCMIGFAYAALGRPVHGDDAELREMVSRSRDAMERALLRTERRGNAEDEEQGEEGGDEDE
jgi:hypothetical protein